MELKNGQTNLKNSIQLENKMPNSSSHRRRNFQSPSVSYRHVTHNPGPDLIIKTSVQRASTLEK